jgi:hypothetical protein
MLRYKEVIVNSFYLVDGRPVDTGNLRLFSISYGSKPRKAAESLDL